MAQNRECNGPPPGARHVAGIVAALETALLERQALLTGPDTAETWRRITAVGLRIADLLDRLAAVLPPAALEDEASAPGEFDRFLDRGNAERRAG